MLAMIDAARNNHDAALQNMENARKQEDWFLLWTKVTPEFDPLRDDPRFQKLLSEMTLPPGIQSK
jgi:hypothetical protein